MIIILCAEKEEEEEEIILFFGHFSPAPLSWLDRLRGRFDRFNFQVEKMSVNQTDQSSSWPHGQIQKQPLKLH